MYKEQINPKIHNRFDIEVIREGKVIQKAMAENIVLDRAFTRLCNFQSYFTYIHFGTGTGSVSPHRTTLFEPLGYKKAEDEEVIKAFPVTKWTRKITLNPEEYVDKVIREVGISDSSSSINTHAIVKDIEGNPLSVVKTEIDIVIIYASVFIELEESSTLKFYKAEDNALLKYLTGGYTSSDYIYLDASEKISSYPQLAVASKSATATADVDNKKRVITTRFGVGEGNAGNKVAAVIWDKVFRTTTTGLFSGVNFENHVIGTGDGVTDTFPLQFSELQNLVVKKDGEILSEASYTRNGELNPAPAPQPLYYFMEVDEVILGGFNGQTNDGEWSNQVIRGKRLRSMAGCKFICTSSSKSAEFFIGFSNDNMTYNEKSLGEIYQKYDEIIEMPDINLDDYEYISLRIDGNGNNYIEKIAICAPDDSNTIKFSTPPALGEVISIDGYVPYLPKTEDYVLDVTLELKFGEGV